MRRSEINRIEKRAVRFFKKHRFHLPPFAFWRPADWKKKGTECREIVDNMLGWDLTDFGSGNFSKFGLLLFTIRNGNYKNKKYIKPYAEKVIILDEGQTTPLHFHWNKMEDIINRGGGNLVIQLYNSTKGDKLASTPVTVSLDGVARKVRAGGIVKLRPGESITLPRRLYHKIWAEKGKGTVLVGEVSCVNDDMTDNCFYEKVGRFPSIEEDALPLYPLCFEYRKYWNRK